MKNRILTLLFGFSSSLLWGQDIHFTMFHVAPTELNPAAAGVFDGNFRASTNYRQQWRSISNPFNTYSCTMDGNLSKPNSRKSANLGAALNVYRDVAGTSRFATTKANLSLSGIVHLSANQTASAGITAGWGQQAISDAGLEWDAQFNGQAFDPGLPSNESFLYNKVSYFDYAAGVLWAYGRAASTMGSYDKFNAQVGLAYHHLSRPVLGGFYGESDRLYSKIVFHTNFHISQPNSRLAYLPRLYFFKQGPAMELNTGLIFRYLIQEGSKYSQHLKGFAVSAGAYYRLGDALSPSVEIEYASWTFGFSYDTNISGLTRASLGRGGVEIFLKFQNPNPFFRFHNRPSLR